MNWVLHIVIQNLAKFCITPVNVVGQSTRQSPSCLSSVDERSALPLRFLFICEMPQKLNHRVEEETEFFAPISVISVPLR